MATTRLLTATSMAIVARATGAETLSGAAQASALAAQQDLATLLTTDPNSGAALNFVDPITGISRARVVTDCIRFGSKGGSAIWPEITFRPTGGMPDADFVDGSYRVDTYYYDLEIWDNSNSGTLMTDIAGAWEELFDRRAGAPPLPLGVGSSYWVEWFVMPTAWYDSNIKSWFMLSRMKFIHGH